MYKRDRRQKASDVFRGNEFVFGKKASFDEVFPTIEDLTVEVYEVGRLANYNTIETGPKSVYGKQNFPGEYIDCSNPLCYKGGFSIGSILQEMVMERQTELDTSKLCQGNEGSPKGRRIHKKCLNAFHIKVSIKYK